MNRDLQAMLDGAWAGAAATLPMSGVMLGAKATGRMGEQPPKEIVQKELGRAGIDASGAGGDALALAMHLGFGACAGALFAALSRRFAVRTPSLLAGGVAYGLLVYTVSYQGWIPAVHLLPAPKHDRPGRQGAMVTAHVVYGATLGGLLAAGTRRGRGFRPG